MSDPSSAPSPNGTSPDGTSPAPKRRVPTVLTLEQALSMSYATLRMSQLGWRVIRVEPTPIPGRKSRGDPNRYIGRPVAGQDRHSYFVAPNVGKEAIALNLKEPKGQETLQRLIQGLGVDVFCTNTMPSRHERLGIDYDTLRGVREDLIWCCISAMGLRHPNVPGYDPVMQALCGFMDLTGAADGPPMQCGLPFTDLKAGDEAYTQTILALWERDQTGRGKQIDVSMARSAASWLQTFMPMLDMDSPPSELHRSGNEHRQFIPVNAYKTSDGYAYVAVGSDAQWERFSGTSMFSELALPQYATNESRRANKVALHAGINAATQRWTSDQVAETLRKAAIPHAPITAIEDVSSLPFVTENPTQTQAPDGRKIRLPPAAVDTPHLSEIGGEMPFCPEYGEHTSAVLAEAGLDASEISALIADGVAC
jgi:itaconate CoA-transferase